MITLSEVSKRFDKNPVVSNISLSVKEGEIIGLLGPNGAGKTTTLRMIAGILPPSSGTITINNLDITMHPEIKSHIGFMPENNPLYDDMTTEEYLSFWANMKGLADEQKKDAISYVVDRCGISEVYFRPIAELSKGYRQRVGFSQAILTKPKILILDEPTEGLDPNQRADISTLIRELSRQRTVIISSHVLSELSKIASRLIVIHKGTVVADATPEKLRTLGQKGQIIELEIDGTGVVKELKQLAGVRSVESDKNVYTVHSDSKTDIREALFKLAVRKKWILLTMYKREQAIEEVFSQLTHS